MKSSGERALKKSRVISIIQSVIGGLVAIFFTLTILFGGIPSGFDTTADMAVLLFCILAIGLGVMLIILGARRRKLRLLCRKYIPLLIDNPLLSIDKLSAASGRTPEAARKNLARMVDLGFFGSASIDVVNNRLVFNPEAVMAVPAGARQKAPHGTATVTCPGCGAEIFVSKKAGGNCAYCGTPLSGGQS